MIPNPFKAQRIQIFNFQVKILRIAFFTAGSSQIDTFFSFKNPSFFEAAEALEGGNILGSVVPQNGSS